MFVELLGSPQDGSISSKCNDVINLFSVLWTFVFKDTRNFVDLMLVLLQNVYNPLFNDDFDMAELFVDEVQHLHKIKDDLMVPRLTVHE